MKEPCNDHLRQVVIADEDVSKFRYADQIDNSWIS